MVAVSASEQLAATNLSTFLAAVRDPAALEREPRGTRCGGEVSEPIREPATGTDGPLRSTGSRCRSSCPWLSPHDQTGFDAQFAAIIEGDRIRVTAPEPLPRCADLSDQDFEPNGLSVTGVDPANLRRLVGTVSVIAKLSYPPPAEGHPP